jgi:recombinational DNA repair protein (RecF pathway)
MLLQTLPLPAATSEVATKCVSLDSDRFHCPEVSFQPQYQKWCTEVFESRLEADVKARKEAATAAKQLHQQTLEPHLREKPDRPLPYTDQLWLDAALEWLIATDQESADLSAPIPATD